MNEGKQGGGWGGDAYDALLIVELLCYWIIWAS